MREGRNLLYSLNISELRPGIYIGKTCSMSFSLRVCQTQGRKVEFYYQLTVETGFRQRTTIKRPMLVTQNNHF